jgi:hypothetical protein
LEPITPSEKMSDSDNEDQSEAASTTGGTEHKGFLYKVKAFKRRTLHKVQKVFVLTSSLQ